MRNLILVIIFILFTIASLVNPSLTFAGEPRVHAVLFYSPSCPHCHIVINEVLPPLIEKHGDSLKIIGVDVSNELGQKLYEASITRFQIPDSRYGVPTLIVGDTVLVGSAEIPQEFPSIIDAGISSNGIPWPDIPGLDEILIEQGLETSETDVPLKISESDDVNLSDNTDLLTTLSNRFNKDISGNSIAVIVLIGMFISVLIVGYAFVTGSRIINFAWPKSFIPILSIVGLFVAIYLSYVEISSSEAVCGPVGDCITVQESPYAYLFGSIPIGLIGILGYSVILILWLLQYFGPSSLQKFCAISIWLMAWFGVLFSIYLTFLEPFVIGATCMWCITSALVMTALLWSSTPPVIRLYQFNYDDYGEIPDSEYVS